MKPVMTTAKSRKAQSFMRSATAPETMDMAVATNTTWKKKSDIRSSRSRRRCRAPRHGVIVLAAPNMNAS
jgi:hypothetical protein